MLKIKCNVSVYNFLNEILAVVERKLPKHFTSRAPETPTAAQ